MKRSKRLLSLLLAIIVIVGVIPIPAMAVGDGTANSAVILACSDVQEPSNSYLYSNGDYTKQIQLLNKIVSKVKTVYPTIDGFFCGGDYNFDVTREGRNYTENGVEIPYTSSIAQTRTQQDAVILSNAVKSLIPGMTDDEIVLIQGNHDTFCDALTASGGYDKGAYSVYVINEKDYPSGGTATQGACQLTADSLRSWLNGLVQADYNKPVFILSHVPLHYSNRVVNEGDAVYAQLLYDAIDSYGNALNIIFLYGHDHAHGDDDYLGGASQFLTRGDKITIAQSGNRTGMLEKTLNFTYMNYGFVGYFWDDWTSTGGPVNTNTDSSLTMTTFEINGSNVTIRRWDENGQHILKAAGAASLGYRGIADPLPANTDTYASPQVIRSPKSGSEEPAEVKSFTDPATAVKVKTSSGNSITVQRKTDLVAKPGVTDYLAYDITVDGFTPGTAATVTMPARPGYNKVWCADDGVWEEIDNAVFSGSTVTFQTNHFSTYVDGIGEIPLDDNAWYLVKTPASELRPGDQVLVLTGDEQCMLYSAIDNSYGGTPDTAWADPYNIESLYTAEGYGTITPVQYNGKTYYSYNGGMQQILTDYPPYLAAVSDGMGLMNGNGKYLNLSFKPFNWEDSEAYKTTAAGTINADGTISAVIGGKTYYLTYNENAGDDWYGFVPRTANDTGYSPEYAQFVFYRLEQFKAPAPLVDPDDDDYSIVDGNADLVELTDFESRIVMAGRDACLYHKDTEVTPETPFANGYNDKIEFYDAFVVDGHTYNVCMKVKFINPPENTQLYWGAKTFSDDGYLSLGQFRNTSAYDPNWTYADYDEPETDIEWELWLEDNNGTHITDEMLVQQTGYHLAGGSVYVAPNEYVSVYSADNTLYTNISEGIEYAGDPVNRWHTIDNNHSEEIGPDSTYNLPGNYIGGIAGSAGIIKGTYRKDYTDAGCELVLGTYPAEPVVPEESDDLVFTKTATQTQPAAENENYFDIELNVKAPVQGVDPAVVLLIDVSSSMEVQCAICGLPSDEHDSGQNVMHWDGNVTFMPRTHDNIADHEWTQRMPIAKEGAVSFIKELHDSTAFDQCYVKLITFGGSIGLNENWIDIKDNTKYNALVSKINNLDKVSGTNIANALKTSYEALTDDFPAQCDPAKSYLVVLSDGASNRTANSGISPTGDNDEALNEDYMKSWYDKWSAYPHFEETIVNEALNAPVYMGPVWYADQIHNLGTEIYSVILGNSLDLGEKSYVENWRYIIGLGLDNDDYMDSFSDVCSHANTVQELTSFYANVARNINYVKDITVTDPMAENIEFICFVDANGNEISIPTGVSFDDATKTITWDLPNGVSENKLYYRIRVQNENFTTSDETQNIPTNDTTRAEYTLVVNGVSSRKYQDAEIPEVETYEGTLEFDKVDQFGNKLDGVEFTLTLKADDGCEYDADYNGTGTDNHVWSAVAKSDANGHVVFTHIPSGHTFTLTETENPYLDTLPTIDCGATVAYGVTTKTGSDWTHGNVINEVPVFYVVHHAVHVNAAERQDDYYDDFVDIIPMYALDENDGMFDLTVPLDGYYDGIRDGYIYGGMYKGIRENANHDPNDTTVPNNNYDTPDDNGWCGKELRPEAWNYYYLREVSEEFLQPRIISVRRYANDTHVERYLLTAIDEDGADHDFYTEYGFIYEPACAENEIERYMQSGHVYTDNTEEIYDERTDTDSAEYEDMNCILYEYIDVNYSSGTTSTYEQTTVFSSGSGYSHITDDDYFGCVPYDSRFADGGNLNNGFTYDFHYTPYYVTSDGVFVSGIKERYVDISNAATATAAVNHDVPLETGSMTYKYKRSLSLRPMMVASCFMANPNTVPETPVVPEIDEITVTIHANGETSTVSGEAGDFTSLVEAPACSGLRFAGWYADEAFTVPADFTDVTEDMDVYARYIGDAYFTVQVINTTSKKVITKTRVVTVVDDRDLYREVGLEITVGGVKTVYALNKDYASVSGYSPVKMYGSAVDKHSRLIYQDIDVKTISDGTVIEMTPYYITADGMRVPGKTRTVMYYSDHMENYGG